MKVLLFLSLITFSQSGLSANSNKPSVSVDKIVSKVTSGAVSRVDEGEIKKEIAQIEDKETRRLLLQFLLASLDESSPVAGTESKTASLAIRISALPQVDVVARKELVHFALFSIHRFDTEIRDSMEKEIGPILNKLTVQSPMDPDLYSYQYYLVNPYSKDSLQQSKVALEKCLTLKPTHSLCQSALASVTMMLSRRVCVGSEINPALTLMLTETAKKNPSKRGARSSLPFASLVRGIRETGEGKPLEFELSADGIRAIRAKVPTWPKQAVEAVIVVPTGTLLAPVSLEEFTGANHGVIEGMSLEQVCLQRG